MTETQLNILFLELISYCENIESFDFKVLRKKSDEYMKLHKIVYPLLEVDNVR